MADLPAVTAALSLSVRVAEDFSDKERTTMTLDELIALARAAGYEALCMRASQAGVHTAAEAVAKAAAKIRAAGLAVSMVTGDFAVPRNDASGPGLLRDIGPHLDLAEAFGCRLIRVCMKTEDDIEWARRASDRARERGIRLAHQSHCASLFETVAGSWRVLEAVGRPDFGLIYEPANWMIAGEPYGRETILRFAPHIFNVYVQNHRIRPSARDFVPTWKLGPVHLDHIGIWEQGGVDYAEVLGALREIGYGGAITVHQAFGGIMPVAEAVRRSGEFLRKG